jgi:hypothetical protein
LIQLSNEATTLNPRAAEVIARDMYVDDLLTGADSLQESKELQQGVSQIFEKGGFSLHKWCANEASIVEAIPEQRQKCQLPYTFEKHNRVKTLGLIWDQVQDVFQYPIKFKPSSGHHKTDGFSNKLFNI